MDKYTKIISELEESGVIFDRGIPEQELAQLEILYDVKFPIELKQLYNKAMPTSEGFYNWRDTSNNNIRRIRRIIDAPINELLSELRDGYFWCEEFGDKPNSIYEAEQVLLNRYQQAPKLIPIYSHRYIPFIEGDNLVPVFSVRGSDIIYYGEDLVSYFETEFGLKKASELNQSRCQYVNFWSDLI